MHLSRAILLVVLGLFVAIAARAQVILGIDPSIHGGGPPPVDAPVVHNLTVQLSIPINTNFTVGTPTVDNTPLTGCIITSGNGAGNYAINNSTCAITVTNPTGKNNLTTMGTDTLTVQATNTGGSGSGTVTIVKWLDGATFATCTTPQYPTLLAGLIRAPWQVAGVDYCVGPADGTVFKIPSAGNLPPGSTLTGSTILVSTANTVIDGWNFTGFTLDINANNITVRNSIFSNSGQVQLLRLENTAQVFTFNYNNVNGSGITSTGGLISAPCTATTVTYKYNWVRNAPQHLFQSCAGTIGSQFNLLENPGLVTAGSVFTQETGNTGGSITLSTQFNTARLYNGKTTSGLAFTPSLASYTGASLTDYNTLLAAGGITGLVSDGGIQLTSDSGVPLISDAAGTVGTVLNDGVGPSNNTGLTISGTLEAKNNYAGYTGGASGVFLHCGTAAFTSYANNVNMVTGAQFPLPAACPGNPPVVTAQTYSIPSNSPIGTFVGTINATNAPTSYSLVNCTPGCTGFFTLPSPTSNQIQTAVTFSNVAATYTLTARADNPFGFGQANETINITIIGPPPPGVPVVTAQTFTISTPASNGDVVGSIIASGSPNTYAINSCSGCTGWFSVDNLGVITVTTTGATGMPGTVDKQTLHPVVTASNVNGASTPVTDTVNAYADGSPGGPGTAAQFPDLLGDHHVVTVALNQTGAGYQNGDIVQAYGVGTSTANGVCSKWPKWQVTHAGTTGRILADGLTLVDAGNCSQQPTTEVPLACINCQGTQASVNITWSANSTTYAVRPPWKVAGVDYGVGPIAGTVFKTPGVSPTPSCVAISGNTFIIKSSNCVIDGWDFTVGAGWGVQCGDFAHPEYVTNNPVVTNNKFSYNSAGFSRALTCYGGANGVNGIGLTFKNNSVVTNGFNDDQTVWVARGGTVVIEYNIVQHAVCDLVKQQAEEPPIQTNVTVKWNVWNGDAEHGPEEGCHGDILQTFGETPPTTDYTSLLYNFNLVIMPVGVTGTDGVILQCNGYPNCTVGVSHFNYNTGIFDCAIAGCVNEWVRIGGDNVPTTPVQVFENYAAPHRNINSVFQLFDPQATVPANFQLNKNMITGGNCQNNGNPC